MEIDFYWCEDETDSVPGDASLLGEETSATGSLAFQQEVDIPPRRNPFGAPPPREQQPRGSPPVNVGKHNQRARARANQQKPASAGFFSSLLSVFDGKSPERSPRQERRRPRSGTVIGGVRSSRNGDGSSAVQGSLFGAGGLQQGVGSANSLLSTPSGSPGKAHDARMSNHTRTQLFKPENRAKILAWVAPSLRSARLRRPEGKGMVLRSLGIEVVQKPCGDGLTITAISQIVGDSPADQTQQLFAGDALVEVNGAFVAHLDLEKIIMIVATAGKNVTFKVTTSEALTAALTTLLEQHKEELMMAAVEAAAVQDAASTTPSAEPKSGKVYSGSFWEDAPDSPLKRSIVISPDSSMLPLDALTTSPSPLDVSGMSAISPSNDDDDDSEGAAKAADCTSAPVRPPSPEIHMATPQQRPGESVADPPVAVSDAPVPANPGSATTTEPKKTEKEYGFYVRKPSDVKNRRRRNTVSAMPSKPEPKATPSKGLFTRFFSASLSDGAAAAATTATATAAPPAIPAVPEVYVDERRISRDIINMRPSSARSLSKRPSAEGLTIAAAVSPTNRLPAGLLSPDDCVSPPAPVLSLTDHVRVATLNECSKVVAFLAASGLTKYVELFEEEEIDYETLASLTESDLEKMGIDKLGARRKLLRAIRQLDIPGDYAGSEYSSYSLQSAASNAFSARMVRALSDASITAAKTPSDLSNYGSMATPELIEEGETEGALTETPVKFGPPSLPPALPTSTEIIGPPTSPPALSTCAEATNAAS